MDENLFSDDLHYRIAQNLCNLSTNGFLKFLMNIFGKRLIYFHEEIGLTFTFTVIFEQELRFQEKPSVVDGEKSAAERKKFQLIFR